MQRIPKSEMLVSEAHEAARAPRHLLTNIRRLNELYDELNAILEMASDGPTRE